MPDCHTGVFAFEGDWHEDLTKKDSIRPTLETLRDVQKVSFVHRRIGTAEELKYYLERWLGGEGAGIYDDYLIGYFAFHGEQGLISPGEGRVSLDQIAIWMNGRAQGRTLYFGSCSTLDLETKRIKRFLRSTKARAVVGFTRDVDWLQTAAFDLILLDALAWWHQRPHLTNNYLHNKKRKHLKAFAEELGLKIITPSSKP